MSDIILETELDILNIDNFNNSIQYFDIKQDYDNINKHYKPKLKNSNKVSSSTPKKKKKISA